MTITFLTVQDCAERAQLHRQTIADALRLGTLHGTQRSRRGTWLVAEECFQSWVFQVPCSHKQEKIAA